MRHVVCKAWIEDIRKLTSKKGDYYIPKQGTQEKNVLLHAQSDEQER